MTSIYHQTYSKERVAAKSFDLALIKRLLSYFVPYWLWTSLSILMLFMTKIIEAAVPLYLGYIINKILAFSGTNEEQKTFFLAFVMKHCSISLSLLFFCYLLDGLNVVLKSWIGQRALYRLRMHVYLHIEKMPLKFFDSTRIGRLITRTIHDVDQINQMFTESLIPIAGNLMLFVCIAISIFIIDWRLGLFLAIFFPIVLWLTNIFRVNQRKAYDNDRAVISALNGFVQEHLMGASTIRSFDLHQIEKERFEEMNEDHQTAQMDSVHNFSLFISAIDFLQSLSLILIFVLLISFTSAGSDFAGGTFFALSLYVIMFFRPLTDLAERYNVLQSAMAAAERIFQVLDQDSEVDEDNQALELAEVTEIAFEHVWFAYEHEDWILKDLSFRVLKNESLALVGITGAGKTTLISLLLRFYDIQKGSITINGVDIRHYTLSSLRRHFSVVLQDPVLFSGTIMDNLALFDSDRDRNAIYSTLEKLNLRHFFDRFPKGLDHQLTEHGKELSVGEMQLISLCRAVVNLRGILIFDEATANIDSQTEHIIQQALPKILHRSTALVIAHRLSTIRDVTRILVLHQGAVAESGTHAQLVTKDGIYEKLNRLQFQADF